MIRLVEQSDLPVRATLRQLSIAPSTFYGWYERNLGGGHDALEDRKPPPRAVDKRQPSKGGMKSKWGKPLLVKPSGQDLKLKHVADYRCS